MSLSVDEIAHEIVRTEGGFVNDPDDPGGPTNFGVTLGTLERLGFDVDQDGDVDINDVRALTVEHAVDIFKRHYYQAPGIWRIAQPLQPTVFDMQVNAGPTAIRLLQKLVNMAGFGPLTEDGLLGPNSARAAQTCFDGMGELMVDAYSIQRRRYYYALGDKNARLRKFARRRDGGKGGWIVRAEMFMDPHFHFSEADHRMRTSEWS